MWIVALLWILNAAISWWNAYACGKAWVEAKACGGWPRFMCWMGAIMSASGFSWCILILLALLAHGCFPQHFPIRAMVVSIQAGYVVIIPGVLFSGLMITIDSWANAYRNGGFVNYGIATYNTYAQIHNTYSAIEGMGDAISSIFEFLGDDDDNATLLVIAVVITALVGGILLTTLIIRKNAATEPLRQWPKGIANEYC